MQQKYYDSYLLALICLLAKKKKKISFIILISMSFEDREYNLI